MKFKRGGRLEANVELTPLIDVVFLLLIFFMVSSTFIRESQLTIDLPEATGEPQQIEQDVIEISIDRRGEYALNGQMLVNSDIETLMRALRDAITDADKAERVIVTADANATHQAVVRAMDAAGRVGLTRISITTQQPEDEW